MKQEHDLRYHKYLIPKGTDLNQTVLFAYGYSVQSRGRKIPQLVDVQEESLPDHLSEVELAGRKEVGEKWNEYSDGVRTGRVAGGLIGSDVRDVQDE